MAQKESTELVSVLLFDNSGNVLLKNVENRGLWLPVEQKRETETIASVAQKIADLVSLFVSINVINLIRFVFYFTVNRLRIFFYVRLLIFPCCLDLKLNVR